LPDKAATWVREHAKATGVSVSAVYRKALGAYITGILTAAAKEKADG